MYQKGSMDNETILLGDDAEVFFKSDLGQYVLQSAIEEVDAALEQLKEVNPEDVKKVRELQNRIKIAEAAPRWLRDAIHSGRQILAQREQENG